MKTGNMFTCPFADDAEMRDSLRKWNRLMVKKGLRAVPLRKGDSKTLVYVFRPNHLEKDLQNKKACRLLQERGYCCETPGKCLAHLRQRLSESEDFPHEIGLFLGYPPEDVCGFIENKPCKCTGCWKVYGDEEAARKTFAKYKKCTSVYCSQWKKGSSLDRLIVKENKIHGSEKTGH